MQGNVVFLNLDWALVSLREVQTHLATFFNVQWGQFLLYHALLYLLTFQFSQHQ